MNISDKKVLLIGGNGILGTEYTKFLNDKVKSLSIIDLNNKNIKKFLSTKTVFYKSDVTKIKNFKKNISLAIKNMGGIDVLINNAALTSEFSRNKKGVFDEFNFSSWQESLNVTLSGTYIACVSVLPYMIKQKGGKIINISSHYGVVSPNHNIYKGESFNCPVSYTVAKHGVIGLTKWLATKYAKLGIQINSLSPGGVKNNQPKSFIKKYSNINPSNKMAKKNDYNGIIEFLISDQSNYSIGHNYIIDGGASVW
tara:strand:- start:327 stop:1088 length:762 start_codon:yes stop_codon:yes gene_type:complete